MAVIERVQRQQIDSTSKLQRYLDGLSRDTREMRAQLDTLHATVKAQATSLAATQQTVEQQQQQQIADAAALGNLTQPSTAAPFIVATSALPDAAAYALNTLAVLKGAPDKFYYVIAGTGGVHQWQLISL